MQFWRVADGTLLRTLTLPARIKQIAFSPDGQLLGAATQARLGSSVQLWRVSDGTLERTIPVRARQATSLAFHPGGTMVAVGAQDSTSGALELWPVQTDAQTPLAFYAMPSWVFAVAFSPDGQYLASGGGTSSSDGLLSGLLRLPPWQTITVRRMNSLLPDWFPQRFASPQASIKSLAFSTDGSHLVASGGDTVAVFQTPGSMPRWVWLVGIGAGLGGLLWTRSRR